MLNIRRILLLSLLLRLAFFLFGLYQDAYMPLPYTDIDYFVFTDASRFVFNGDSPFKRLTYRYTPLLAWLLVPTNYEPQIVWFSFGKLLFILSDLITGYLILLSSSVGLSLIWLFNPMVITISTRGSSESLLTCFILSALYLVIHRSNYLVSGILLGVSIHLKIYPLIYVPALLLFIDSDRAFYPTINRLKFALAVVLSFITLTYVMYHIYGYEYLYESFIYHLVRLDHRHNFSIYNVLLYINSSGDQGGMAVRIEKLAFLPQLLLSMVVLPVSLSRGFDKAAPAFRQSLIYKILFVQTFAFIMFNKVCTSQYFIWFLCLLPQFIKGSQLSLTRALILLVGWILTQASWLYHGWLIEFKGDFVFYRLFVSAVAFFFWNTYMLASFVDDIKLQLSRKGEIKQKTQ